MIDIISSSIRFGKLLKENKDLNIIADFFSQIANEKDNPYASNYIKLLSSRFTQDGLYSFDVVDRILIENLKNENEFLKIMAERTRAFVLERSNYREILELSKKYGAILNEYIDQLLTRTHDYPQINIENVSIKIQQCSNELSTAILRSGVLSWATDPKKIKILEKRMSFIREYEDQTNNFKHLRPFNKKTRNVINSLSANQRKLAYQVENIRLVRFLSICGILQGFFFELFDIPEHHILKIKELYKTQSIHPIIIKTDLIYPTTHMFLFRYFYEGKVSYLLAEQLKTEFSQESHTTTIIGYRYPTNEYSLFRVDL